MQTITPVILSGGSGTRLWPLSRASYPKQFLTFDPDRSLFQSTVERALSLSITQQNPWVICNDKHAFLIEDQLTAMGVLESTLLVEPSSQDTAAAIIMAALEAHQKDPNAILWVMPSDHSIHENDALEQGLKQAMVYAQKGMLVTFGIQPNHPNTHYGYIQQGPALSDGVFKITSFTEKPSIEKAQAWIASGDYYWNSGMFVFQAHALLDLIEQLQPELLAACQNALATHFEDLSFIKYKCDAYQAIEAISFDYAIMEKTAHAVMVPLDIQWSDLGTWKNVKDHQTPKDGNNAIIGDVVEKDVENCYLHASSRLLVAMGLKNQIVVETPDAVLVADAACSGEVRDVVKQLEQTGHSQALEHPLVHRPWGSYQTLILSDRFQVKMLTIKPGARLSKQKHLHRAEHWVVVAGTAEVLRDTETLTLAENQSVYIPLGAVHYVENPGHIELKIIEVQTGSYLGEDDIIRLEDRYGRVDH